MNITDLDDKIIQRANERNITCDELTQKFELEFHEDMEALGVAPPNVLTRVTEYMDEIVTYIQTIVEKGLAYESNGSVYFNVDEFDNQEGMKYCKLEPEQIGNAELLAEGEGKLTQDFVGDKRSPRDFALWKRSKEGEPSWDSPWGEGRPGWHIECSVMASDVFAQMSGGAGAQDIVNDKDMCRMDIHSGGVDLKFPHHDNEMAQAEAHSGCCQWVNYFVHAGHLNIKGFKMSKSLKNFISIREALNENTARQVRLCFLLAKYNAEMDYGDGTMSNTLSKEKMFVEFFHNVKAVLRDGSITDRQRWDADARELQKTIEMTRNAVDTALQDDFDTPKCFMALEALLKATNLYLEKFQTDESRKPVSLVVRNAAKYVTIIFKTFGLIPENSGVEIGFPVGGGANTEDTLRPVLDALIAFRSNVRDKARQKDFGGVLEECDNFRDGALPPLGIRLEDKPGQSVWKLQDAQELMKEKEQMRKEKERKELEKIAAAEEKKKKDALNKLSPELFMKQLTLDDDSGKKKYSQFENDGMPTHFHDGEALNKNQVKKAKKEFTAQSKKYEKSMKKS